MPSDRRDRVVSLLKLLVVAGAFAYLLASGRLDLDAVRFSAGGLPLAAAAVGALLFADTLSFLRWWYLLRVIGVDLPGRAILQLSCIGLFFNTFLFGGVGGDMVKVAYVARATHQRSEAAASILVDRLCGLTGLLLLGGLALGLSWSRLASPGVRTFGAFLFALLAAGAFVLVAAALALLRSRLAALLTCLAAGLLAGGASLWGAYNGAVLSPPLALGLIAALAAGAVAAVLLPSLLPGGRLAELTRTHLPFGTALVRFAQSILAYRRRAGQLVLAGGGSVFIHAAVVGAVFATARALQHPATAAQIFFAGPPAMLANVLPVPGGGLGVGETAFAELLRLCRTPEGEVLRGGAAVFLAFRALLILVNLVLGLPAYLYRPATVRSMEEASAPATLGAGGAQAAAETEHPEGADA
jgi:uncharacterized membrane protein YbhN (UPF0104 family)